ncbi:MAG: small multi-drug export protein [Candidatus Cyclobacteriaceae bacterium M3_2C_046]
MIEEVLKYLSVYLMSMLKFIAGPTMGAAIGLSFLETFVLTVTGMMTSVVLISLFGKNIRNWSRKYFRKKKTKRIFTKSNRRFVFIWKNYGILGVSFLTPIIFSPILGALLLTTLGAQKKQVFLYMFISAVFWGLTFSKFWHFFINLNFLG